MIFAAAQILNSRRYGCSPPLHDPRISRPHPNVEQGLRGGKRRHGRRIKGYRHLPDLEKALRTDKLETTLKAASMIALRITIASRVTSPR